MKISGLLKLRLRHQLLTASRARQPQEVVQSLLAMQAQEYAMAKWAIGLRMTGTVTDARIEQAFDEGKILRTHVLRPTWHFVSPADIRWLLALTAPRVHVANAHMYRQLELDAAIFKRADAVLVRALQPGKFLTRPVLQAALARSGIEAEGPRLGYLMMHAELEGLICSGPREGRQFTYALLDSRVPAQPAMGRDAALAELSRRYFGSRGPATARDFATWSGLTVTAAREGVESLGADFERVVIDGQEHAYRPAPVAARVSAARTPCFAFLMPDYDEYGMSYRDRSALFPRALKLAHNRMIVVDGQIVGSWRRSLAGSSVSVELDCPVPLNTARRRAVAQAIRRFTSFTQR